MPTETTPAPTSQASGEPCGHLYRVVHIKNFGWALRDKETFGLLCDDGGEPWSWPSEAEAEKARADLKWE